MFWALAVIQFEVSGRLVMFVLPRSGLHLFFHVDSRDQVIRDSF